jgi:mRNA-degrading endonuclease RelE of RelBE toxin-antitoxin system
MRLLVMLQPGKAMSNVSGTPKPPELRLRVGNYRVRFYHLSDSIFVLAVKHRRDAYR